jgi:predicted nuclease with TOPRIM domain
LEEQLKRNDQILTLLPDGESNLSKLQAIVSKSKDKLYKLRSQWEEHRSSLELEHEQLLLKIREKQVSSLAAGLPDFSWKNVPKRDVQFHLQASAVRTEGSVARLSKTIADLEREIGRKEVLREKYSAEVAKLKKSVPR